MHQFQSTFVRFANIINKRYMGLERDNYRSTPSHGQPSSTERLTASANTSAIAFV